MIPRDGVGAIPQGNIFYDPDGGVGGIPEGNIFYDAEGWDG